MLRVLIRFSLGHPWIVTWLAVLATSYSVVVTLHSRLDIFPEFAPPQVVVQTEAAGLSPEQVEVLVTRPLETALKGTPGLELLRSQSIQGLSVITAVFREGTDPFRIRQLVNEGLALGARELPEGVALPSMGPLASSTSLVLLLGLTSTNRSGLELRTFADWVLRPRLLAVSGVARVDLFGGGVRQLQIQVKPDKLAALQLSLQDVLTAARNATDQRGTGFLDNTNQRVVIRVEGAPTTPAELARVPIPRATASPVTLGEVAEVVEASEPKFGDAQIMGTPGVIAVVNGQFGGNTLEITAAVENALRELQPQFEAEDIRLEPRLFRPASFIERALAQIQISLWTGGALVLLMLFLFLRNWQSALISFLSIPISLLIALAVLDAFSVPLNTLSLGGLAIAIGVVVDDAIIDVENILRRLREYQAAVPTGTSLDLVRVREVMLAASIEVRGAIVHATFIVALVFLPVLMMSGVSGRLFAPLAGAFILATLASLIVALTLTPALAYLLLRWRRPGTEAPLLGRFKRRHGLWLEHLCARPRAVAAGAGLLCLAAVATLPFFGGEFLPEFQENHLVLHMAALPGTSLSESLRIGRQVTRELVRQPFVLSVSQQAGRAEQGEDPWGTHLSEFHVQFRPTAGEETEEIQAKLRDILQAFPGVTFKILPFLSERMEEVLSGTHAQVVINLAGEKLRDLDQAAERVQQTLLKTPGATDVQMEQQIGQPELILRLRPERLRQFGFEAGQLIGTLQTLLEGSDVGRVYEESRFFEIVLIVPPSLRQNAAAIGEMLVDNGHGVRLPLRQLAEVGLSDGRYVVAHEAGQRRQQVTCNIQGRPGSQFLRAVRQRLAHLALPSGVDVHFGGSIVEEARVRNRLLLHSLAAAAGIVILLAIAFHRPRSVLLILTNLPFALVGGVLAVFASGGLLSVGSLVGFITLFGISMRNSIMLIAHYQHLVDVEGAPWTLATVLRGASERLTPILLTAVVTGLGLLPIAVQTGRAGHEIEGPMALVILGGLVTSTALNLLVLPALAWPYLRPATRPG